VRLQRDEIAPAQLAVDGQVGQREVAYPAPELRIAQISCGLSGGFCPRSTPRVLVFMAVSCDRLIVKFDAGGRSKRNRPDQSPNDVRAPWGAAGGHRELR
jgi:hypothetical protein